MSLATTCPQCKTSFKVVPDQLKLRRGLVRCGMCRHVFSGVDYLRYVEDAAREAGAQQPRTAGSEETILSANAELVGEPAVRGEGAWSEEAPTLDELKTHEGATHRDVAPPGEWGPPGDITVPDEDTVSPEIHAPADGALPLHEAPPAGEARAEEPAIRAGEPVAATQPMVGTDPFADTQAQDTGERVEKPGAGPGRARATGVEAIDAIDGEPALIGDDAVDFFATGRRARGFSTRSTVFAAIAAFLLALALPLQLVIGSRDWLAARLPGLGPVLAVALAPFGLKIQPPRELDALTIESFELQAAGARNMLALNALLRNGAEHTLRWPAMELSLTDGTGATVVRKVLLPEDYVGPAQRGLAGIAAKAEWPVRVALHAEGVEATGYSVKLFYH